MKLSTIELNPDSVIVNAAIATRKGGHDPDSIDLIAKSYMTRHDEGLEPYQIMDGLVRALEDGTYELIDGDGRLQAVKVVNGAGGLNGEPMTFRARVVRANDEAAVISGIQANFHDAVDAFDRADAMQKLIDLGKKQKDVASIFGMSEGTVTQMLKLNKVEKKFVKAYRDGDLDQEAVIAIADLPVDDVKRMEIFEEAVRHRNKVVDILAKKEFRDKKAQLDAEIERAKERAKELEAAAKEAEKAAKEADKALAKTKDEAELADARKAAAAAKKAKDKIGKEWSAATKEVEKLRAAKDKLEPPTPTKKAARVEDVKEAAKEKGVKNVGPTPRNKGQLVAAMESFSEDNKNPLPEPANTLIGKIEEFLDGECTEKQLRNAFLRCCREQFAK
jgi:ParB-like chromosome segregation protein Spo0J